MKSCSMVFSLLFIFSIHACRNKTIKTPPEKTQVSANQINYTDLNSKTKIIGALKLPMGSIAEIKCELIDGDDTQLKRNMGLWLLKVIEINNQKVSEDIILNFIDETGDLPEQKSYRADEPNKDDKSIIMSNGKKLSLVVYETGRFTGMPENYMNYAETRADTDFYFKSFLIVIKNNSK